MNYKIIIAAILSLALSNDFENLSFGTDDALDVITWNIEWFPKNGNTTIEYVTEIIEYLDVDVIAIQELDDISSFNEMLNDLPDFSGYYESSWFAGLAYVYKNNTVQINDIYEIYTTSPYWSPFPRSPMVMDMNFMGENYIIINNHYKCCGDGNLNLNDDGDEEMRRYIANTLLKEYIDENFSDKNVILLGDLNDELTDNPSNNVFQMFFEDPQHYLFSDYEIAQGNSDGWSFPNWPSHLDHILITDELFSTNHHTEVIMIDDFMNGGFNSFDQNISDHRPVAIKVNPQTILTGDLNNDQLVNVLDVVVLIDIILSNENNFSADLNFDNSINVLDVVVLVNIILT